METLKPCPFCGGVPKVEQYLELNFRVQCLGPKCKVWPSTIWGTKDEAIEWWNTRKEVESETRLTA